MTRQPIHLRTLLVKLLHNISAHEIFDDAAALAFYFSLGLGPLLVLLLSGLAMFNLDKQVDLVQTAYVLLGPQTAQALALVLEQVNQQRILPGLSGGLALGILLFTASLTFTKIQSSLNKIFHVPGSEDHSLPAFLHLCKKYVVRRLISFGMLFVFIFLTIIVLVAAGLLGYLFSQKENFLLGFLLGTVAHAAIFTVLFAAIYKILPDRRVSIPNAFLSGAITAVFFTFGKVCINIYLREASVGSPYGAAGTVVVLLAWIYFSSFVMFAGAEVSFLLVLTERRKHIIEVLEGDEVRDPEGELRRTS